MASTYTSLGGKAEYFASTFGFLVPLVIPWMQELCQESATESMRMIYELPESTIPSYLIPRTSLKFETIRDSIIPQLFKFINSTPDPKKYLTDRFNYYYMAQKKQNKDDKEEKQDTIIESPEEDDSEYSSNSDSSSSSQRHRPKKSKQLTERRLELFISSLVSDLITFDHYQRNSISDDIFSNLKDLLPLDVSIIIQYIKILIWEYHKSILNEHDHEYVYNEYLCCNSLLTILNHEYTHHLLIEKHHQNVSDFCMFAEYLHENAIALAKFKRTQQTNDKQLKELQQQIHDLKQTKETHSMIHARHKRPSSQSLPQRAHAQKASHESPLPTINRLDIHAVHQVPVEEPPEIMWQPLEEMYELFEPRHKHTKKFQRIRQEESIPPPPKHGLPGFKSTKTHTKKYKIIPKAKGHSISPKMKKAKPTTHPNIILPLPPRSNKPKNKSKAITNGPYKNLPPPVRPSKPLTPRRIRTMTLSRPAKLESLSKDEFMGKYLVEGSKIIGQGSFAKIYRCKKKKQNTILAMKIVKKQKANKDDVRAMRREISALALVYHEHVIRIHDWCETTQHIFIVLDYCGGGNVFDRVMELQTFTEMQASKLIKQVADALKHIHSLGIVHRDLKPENLMYTGPHHDQLKVIDFGLSNRIKINGMFISQKELKKKNIAPEFVFSLTTPCGTPHYAAPELLKNQKYGSPVDLWALGVIIYLLLCGFPPFFDTNIKNMFYQIKKAKFGFPSPFWDHISYTAKDLITKLLVVDAKKRYTAQQTLKHPWITGHFEENVAAADSLPVPQLEPIENDANTHNHNCNANGVTSPRTPSPRQIGNIWIPSDPNIDSSKSKRSKESATSSSPTVYGGQAATLTTVVSEHNLSTSNLSESTVIINDQTKDTLKESSEMNGDTDGVYGTPIAEHEAVEDANDSILPQKVTRLKLVQSKSENQALSNPPVPFHVESELFNALDNDGVAMSDALAQKDVNWRGIKKGKTRSMNTNTKRSRPRVDTRGANAVAYMVDGTIFQIQKKQINKLKLEIQQEQQNLEKLANQLRKERRVFMEERERFERNKSDWDKRKEEWINEHQHLMQLKLELNDVVNKFLTLKK